VQSPHRILIVIRGKDLELDSDSWLFFKNVGNIHVSTVDFERISDYFREICNRCVLLVELIDRLVEANLERDSIPRVDREIESAIWLNPELQEVLGRVMSVLTAFLASWDSPSPFIYVPVTRNHQLIHFDDDRVSNGVGVLDRNQSARISRFAVK